MAMYADGWKDEEGDVDDSEIKGKRPTDYPLIKSPDISAQTCGCDKGANWKCSIYPRCAFGRAGG